MPEISDAAFVVFEALLAALLVAWGVMMWRRRRLARHFAFQVVPFLVVIALFSVAFYAERGHDSAATASR